MQKKNLVMALLALSMISANSANAFGLGDLTKMATPSAEGANSSVSGDDVEAFIQTAQHADELITQSAAYIYSALASQEDKSKYEAALKAANDIADVAEKKAKLEKIQADTATALQKTLNSQETIKSIKSMGDQQRKHLAGAAFNFMLGLMKDKELAARSAVLVKGVSANPMLVMKLVSLKEAVTSVSAQVKNSVKIADGLVSMAKAGNMKVMPASTSDKPVAVSSI